MASKSAGAGVSSSPPAGACAHGFVKSFKECNGRSAASKLPRNDDKGYQATCTDADPGTERLSREFAGDGDRSRGAAISRLT